MIAIGPREIGLSILFVAFLHLVDRLIAGIVQCPAMGTCPW